jgi:hypothetical protein
MRARNQEEIAPDKAKRTGHNSWVRHPKGGVCI